MNPNKELLWGLWVALTPNRPETLQPYALKIRSPQTPGPYASELSAPSTRFRI